MCPAFLQFWCNVIRYKSAYKNGFHCYLCSLYVEHVCYEPFSLTNFRFGELVEFCVLRL